MATPLHKTRLDTIVSALLDSGATRVIDLGCGQGELLLELSTHSQFDRIVGIDVDKAALSEARLALNIDWLQTDGRIQVRYASFENADASLGSFDAAVMLETIEHVHPGRLSKVEQAIFDSLRPDTVLITTPNQEYNILHGMLPGQLRHPGHYFEWTRAKFQTWSEGIAGRHDYRVNFVDIGDKDPLRGSSTQMARFLSTKVELPEVSMV